MKKKLQGAAQEAEGILNEARQKAQRVFEENEQRIRTETERIKEETTQEIDRERRKALQDVRGQTADLALLIAEKVLNRSLVNEDNTRLAKEALDAIEAHQQNGGAKK